MKLKPKQKKSDPTAKLVLEEIIGLTTKNSCGLAANLSGECAYVAGCAVVVYNLESGTRKHMRVPSRMPKPLNCVSVFCRNGSCYIAAGESGHQPAVLIWDNSDQSLLAELKGHRYGIACIDFSPDGKHLVSVGFPNDGYICLWDWRSGRLLSKLKAGSSCIAISSICFSLNGSFFITAGRNHLKAWTLGLSTKPRVQAGGGLVIVDGKPTNLGNQKGSCFVAVASAAWMPGRVHSNQAGDPHPIYALTDAGILCLLHSGFSIRKWVNLKVERAFALSISNKFIACACNNGIVQLLMVESLKHIGKLPYSGPTEASTEVPSFGTKSSEKVIQVISPLPDAIACQFSTADKLVVVYNDHSIYIWDVHDMTKVSRCCILVSHSSCIWDVKSIPGKKLHDISSGCVVGSGCPAVSFATCSADGTIRLWDLALQSGSEVKNPGSKIAMNRQDSSPNTKPVGSACLVNTGIFDQDAREPGTEAPGFRSMAVSSDGKYLAAGDYQGNLHVYNLDTSDYTCFQDAHDAEILSLSFSSPSKIDGSIGWELSSHYLLASGGRDQIIHVYDVKKNFDLIESLDDHSAAVTSVKFTCNGNNLLSCSADRTILFRDVATADGVYNILRRYHHVASNGTVYDMAIDPAMEVVVTVGQDRKINIFDLVTGKLIRAFKQDVDFGEPIKVTVDPSGSYLVFSYSDRSFSIHDFTNGDIVARAVGHSEVITGIIFLPDCKHIITVGGDSCIFVWKMPALLSLRMLQKFKEHASYLCPMESLTSATPSEVVFLEDVSPDSNGFQVESASENSELYIEGVVTKGDICEETSTFRFSISRLPKWAQTKVRSNEVFCGVPVHISTQQVQLEIPSSLFGCGEELAIMSPTIQNPCQQRLGNSQVYLGNTSESPFNMDCNQSSPIVQEILRTDMDGRWRTIHTVCLDLLDSPEARDSKDISMPISISTLSQAPDDSQQEGNDLFCQHFSNLSTLLKVEGRRSSARRSFSARFIVRRDHLTGGKRLFEMTAENLGPGNDLNFCDEASHQILKGDLQDPQVSVHCDLGRKYDKGSLGPASNPREDSSDTTTNRDMADAGGQIDGISHEDITLGRTADGRAAFINLDAAADKALKIFQESDFSKSELELSDLGTELLPSITRKVQLLADLVRSRQIKAGSDAGLETNKLEPLIGRFAERLSHQVLELVRNNI